MKDNNKHNNDKNLEDTIRAGLDGEVIEGLPFTIDFKEMIEKTITNVAAGSDQYLKEIIRFAFAGNPSRVDITDNKRFTGVEFKGKGIASKEDLRTVLMGIYNSDDGQEQTNLGMLGRSVVASLKTRPDEIVVQTHDDTSTYVMKIDSGLEPEIMTIDKPSKKNSFKVIKKGKKKKGIRPIESLASSYKYVRTTPVQDGLSDFCDSTLSPLWRFANTPIKLSNLKPNKKKNIISTIEDLCSFSKVPVYFNKKKLNTSFSFSDSLYEKEYKFDDINILVSLPKYNQFREYKRMVYLKNGVLAKEETIHKNKCSIVSLSSYQSMPDVAVDAPGISLNISGTEIVKDNYHYSVECRIDEAKKMFYDDVLKDFKKIGKKDKYELKHFIRSFLYGNQSHREDLNILNLKLFSDLDEKEYAIEDVQKIFQKAKQLYITREEINRNHPAIKDKKGVIFYLESDIEDLLFKDVFPYSCIEDLGEEVKSYDNLKLFEKRQKRKKVKQAVVKGTGYSSASAAAMTGTYYAAPYVASLVMEYWMYGALGAAGLGGLAVTAKVAYMGAKGVAKVAPKAWDSTSNGFGHVVDFINYNNWVGNSFRKMGSAFTYKSLREVRQEKKQKRELKGETMVDDNIREYISALEDNIVLGKGCPDIADYFKHLKNIKIMDKGRFSALFDIEKIDGPSITYNLVVNARRRALSKKAKSFHKSESSLYYDLLKIGKMIGHYLPSSYAKDLEKCVLNSAYSSALDEVNNSFNENAESFKEDFPALSSPEKKSIIKNILGSETAENKMLGEWLIENHGSDLEAAAKDGIAGNYLGRIVSYLDQGMNSAARYEYDLLPTAEKLNLFIKFKDMYFDTDDKTDSHNSFRNSIQSRNPAISAYYNLVHIPACRVRSKLPVGNRIPAFKYRLLRKQLKERCQKVPEERFRQIAQSEIYTIDNPSEYAVAETFSKQGNDRAALLDIAKQYMSKHDYRQLEDLTKLSEI